MKTEFSDKDGDHSRPSGRFLKRLSGDQAMISGVVINVKAAECIVTACAMCHLNIEIRCTLKSVVPIFHFSELLSLTFKTGTNKDWFARHLIDPAPLLKSRGLNA